MLNFLNFYELGGKPAINTIPFFNVIVVAGESREKTHHFMLTERAFLRFGHNISPRLNQYKPHNKCNN